MNDGDAFRAVCGKCNEESNAYPFGTAIAWKVAHGLETGHVAVDLSRVISRDSGFGSGESMGSGSEILS